MFEKVLIANRGAIAHRIIRTLRRLQIKSVAVYAECDADSLHVTAADEAYSLGDGDARATYMNMERLLEIAVDVGATAVHPGYGFLSENAPFVTACERAGVVFIGPSAEQMQAFGLKHRARELAALADVPLLPGSDPLQDLADAFSAAERIGYPVMLKSSAGGGGIGMQRCNDAAELRDSFPSVKRLGTNHFSDDTVFVEKFIERARHIEVQVFGNGCGQALAIGERDCSAQRRNQKVIEESPAPHLDDRTRQAMHDTAEVLLASVNYRNAGTVEFVLDADTGSFYFLEVNTRLQVEHGVTEEVHGIDLVEWMLRQAAGQAPDLATLRGRLPARGHAIQVRLYAEDPLHHFQPSPGLLSDVFFPAGPGVRIDSWISSGIEVPHWFDPMLAKVIVHEESREAALLNLDRTLDQIRLYGSPTNLDYVQCLCRDEVVVRGQVTTRYLNDFRYQPARIEVMAAGTQTTIQDYPGRCGYWHVGVPPSGPFDPRSFQLANQLLDNASSAAGLEMTVQGPTLRFSCTSDIVLAGATIEASVNGQPLSMHRVHRIGAGEVLKLGRIAEQGARAYLAIAGGIDCPLYLGSRATFTLGQFGGHNGRALQVGDVLNLVRGATLSKATERTLPAALLHMFTHTTALRVIQGPHGAPDFFTAEDVATFFSSDWEVHYNSSRTGVRLIGPKPAWARKSGGEAGLHPSNIHDNAYAFGTVDFTGDMPVILGPDGPSLGGFVCPATVITADLWKLGQLRAGDRVRFTAVSLETAVKLEAEMQHMIRDLDVSATPVTTGGETPTGPLLETLTKQEVGEKVAYRVCGDHFLLVEYGEQVLDIRLRFRAHALMQWLEQHPLPGVRELTPGIRSLQIHYDSQQLALGTLLEHLKAGEKTLSEKLATLQVPSRTVYLPLSWDDEACRQAIEKYHQVVRKDAPWYPSNLEFIRRINGLADIDSVREIVFDAAYLVMGLGDVYLGAPVATPLDPSHRLVTTKYNPARTWTAENSVGIGGSYLCVYGMEGPGGYQFVGRTLQMWNRYGTTSAFEQPWLLRHFDIIRFFPVSHEELLKIRRDFPQGRYELRIEEGSFSLDAYAALLQERGEAIKNFNRQREVAFAKELEAWHRDGQFHFSEVEPDEPEGESEWPAGSVAAHSPVSGSVWKLEITPGQRVNQGDTLLVLESMKMEIAVPAPCAGRVLQVLRQSGQRSQSGQVLVLIQPDEVG